MDVDNHVNEYHDNSPIPQVAMTVSVTDDPNLPVLTFRMWVLGALSCVILSFLNQFFFYRTEPLSISSISAQIAVVPLGHLMAKTLPTRLFFKATRWEFTLNPGPFNVKEHVLITIFANSGAGGVYGMHIVTSIKAFYHKKISFFVSFLILLTTQVPTVSRFFHLSRSTIFFHFNSSLSLQILGFGWAGIFRRYLVLPAEMWWPSNLVQVSLFG